MKELARNNQPTGRRARSTPRPQRDDATSNAVAQELVADQQRDGASGTLRDWWDGATGWLGDKAAEVGAYVSDAWGGVEETVGAYWDAVAETDLDWDDDRISISTDLDTLLPVLPEQVRQAVVLGGVDPAANRATLSLDRSSGAATLDVPDLQLGAMDLGGVSVEGLSLTGLRVVIQDAAALAREGLSDGSEDPLVGWVLGEEYKGVANGGSVHIDRVRATGVTGPDGVAIEGVTVTDLDIETHSERGGLLTKEGAPEQVAASFSVGGVVVDQLAAGDIGARRLQVSDLNAGLDVDHAAGWASAGLLAGRGLRQGEEQIGDAEVRGLQGTFGADSLTSTAGLHGEGRVAALTAHGLDLDGSEIAGLSASGAGVQVGGGVTEFSADAMRVEGFASGGTGIGALHAEAISGRRDAETTRARARAVGVEGLDTPGFDAGALAAKGFMLDLQNDGGYVGAYAGRLSGEDLATSDVTAERLDLRGVDTRTAIKESGVISNGSVAAAEGRRLATGRAGVDSARVEDLDWRSGPGRFRVDVGAVAASGVDAEHVDAAAVRAGGFRYDQAGATTAVALDRASADALSGQSGDARAFVRQATVTGVAGRRDARGERGHVDDADLRGVSVRVDPRAGQPAAGAPAPSAVPVPSVAPAGGRGGVATGSRTPGDGTGKLDPVALAGLVDDAELTASVPLNAKDYGLVEVNRGTIAKAHATVHDGRLVPEDTRVETSQPLDGPAWIGVNGAYMEAGDHGGARVRADLSGMYDLDVTGKLPGVRGDLPLDVQALAALATARAGGGGEGGGRLTAPAAQGSAGSGATGTAVPARAASAGSSGAGSAGAVDLGGLRADATVGLSGQLALPGVQATLSREDPADNRVDVHARGTDLLAVEFVRLLVSALRVDLGGGAVSAGRASVADAQVIVDSSQGSPQVQGDIGRVRVQDLDVHKGR